MQKRAFTIVELAIVLIIIGILVGGGASLYSVTMKQKKVAQTKDYLTNALNAVVGFAKLNDNKLPDNDGFKKSVRTDKDGWYREFSYIADDDLKSSDICSATSTNIKITGKDEKDNVAFVIISGGENRQIETELNSGEVEIKNYGEDGYDDITIFLTLPELIALLKC